MTLAEEIGDKHNIRLLARNIGNLYYSKGNINKSTAYYNRAHKMDKELGGTSGTGNKN